MFLGTSWVELAVPTLHFWLTPTYWVNIYNFKAVFHLPPSFGHRCKVRHQCNKSSGGMGACTTCFCNLLEPWPLWTWSSMYHLCFMMGYCYIHLNLWLNGSFKLSFMMCRLLRSQSFDVSWQSLLGPSFSNDMFSSTAKDLTFYQNPRVWVATLLLRSSSDLTSSFK